MGRFIVKVLSMKKKEIDLASVAETVSDYLTTTQAAEKLSISRKRVLQLIHADRLPAVKLGTDFFIKPDDLKLVSDRKPGRPSTKVAKKPATSLKAAKKASRKGDGAGG